MKPVVAEDQRTRIAAPDEQTAWAIGFLCGLALAVVGFVDSALLFYPPQFASIDWEFGTVSGMIEGMPLLTLGLSAMVVAATARGWVKWRRTLSVVAFVVALFTLAMGIIYALDLPPAFGVVTPAGLTTLKKAAFKTSSMAVCYVVFYAVLGVWTWPRVKSSKGAS